MSGNGYEGILIEVPFVAREIDGGKWGIFTGQREELVRVLPSKKWAEAIADLGNRAVNCKVTSPGCPACHGIGGCYLCDS